LVQNGHRRPLLVTPAPGRRDSHDILDDRPPPPADARIAYGPEPLQFGDLRLPPGPGPHPLAVVVHGGVWMANYNLIHTGHMCQALAEAGIASWNVEYRRYGDVGGGWPGTLADVELAVAHVPRLAGTDPSRVVLVGHSAGGHLALLTGRRAADRIRGVVAIAPVADPERWDNDGVELFFGGPPPPDGSPPRLVPLGVRQVVVQGTADTTIPFALSAGYAEAARAAGDDVELLTLEGAGHFEPVDPQAAEWPAVLDAIRALLG
jgi:acetyl esterase/lipase